MRLLLSKSLLQQLEEEKNKKKIRRKNTTFVFTIRITMAILWLFTITEVWKNFSQGSFQSSNVITTLFYCCQAFFPSFFLLQFFYEMLVVFFFWPRYSVFFFPFSNSLNFFNSLRDFSDLKYEMFCPRGRVSWLENKWKIFTNFFWLAMKRKSIWELIVHKLPLKSKFLFWTKQPKFLTAYCWF